MPPRRGEEAAPGAGGLAFGAAAAALEPLPSAAACLSALREDGSRILAASHQPVFFPVGGGELFWFVLFL